jgi:murein DD-endopeptidase MepM/ murein hydrolase activator NlpD
MRAILSIFLVLSLLVAPVAQSKKRSTSVTALRGNLKKIKTKKGAVAHEINKTKNQVKKVKGDLQEVDNRLSQVQVALEETTDKLEVGKKEQQTLSERLEIAKQELSDTKEQVRRRLRWYYVHGQESNLSLLVGSKSTGDLATWKDLMERVAAKDREVFTKYRDLHLEVATKKARQDRLVVHIRGLVDTQKHQKVQLDGVRSEKVEILSDLRQRQAELQKILRQLEADEAAIGNQIEAYLRAQRKSGKSIGKAPTGRFMKPTGGHVTSSYGYRFHPILKVRKLHAGVDFSGAPGAPIWAANSGVVIAAQRMRGYGNVVIIDHGGGVTTTYGHCSRLFVSRGQRVQRGARIASVGSTGLATGPHLHFEIRINGKTVNPMGYL